MLLIECANIKKYYGDRLILDIEGLKIYSNDRIGVVGLNGMGKTTLLNILCGNLNPDEGFVKRYKSFSYISQLETTIEEAVSGETASKFGISEALKEYMSGGEKTKFRLAKGLDERSEIIFADEPTPNLDIDSVKLIEEKFKAYKGALVIVSHDRSFLDRICNKILEIDKGKLKIYTGNYTAYKEQREKENERARFEYEKYQREKKRLENVMVETNEKGRSIKKAPSRMGNSEARLHKMGDQRAKANLDRAAKSIKSRLNNLEVKEKPSEVDKIKLDALSSGKLHSKILISGKNINKEFKDKVIFKGASFDIYNGSKTALIGANGSGKTTLINMIMKGNSSLKISNVAKIGYFSQSLDILDENSSIIENIMKESIYSESFARTLLARLLFKKEDIYKKVELLSGGERVKASFAKIFLRDINLLILDEPTNYLDIYSMEALEEALRDYPKTILFVSHDRGFVSSIADNVLSIEDKKFVSFKGTYEEFIESKTKKIDNSREEKEKRILILENRISELIGRLSMPSKKDNVEMLDKEYRSVLLELKELRR
ncbi:ribosomal protection-like ABC-F family protein [Clostridium cylindrosporum]|uniref:Nucleotide-binding protein ExpZ n=1 Tax=Clostridium cylindrosporum DSM 605 TaxID=1121307 RepID=A0A0J8DDH6_CLOCY|nr:ABC-F type ribosomal protection protein [Clostridium cylindrosporum]KMT22283.1 nucleotide-binding protein ExpZ [Clostridium cylindrosporum DSM 605]